jgi:hypothetical protein
MHGSENLDVVQRIQTISVGDPAGTQFHDTLQDFHGVGCFNEVKFGKGITVTRVVKTGEFSVTDPMGVENDLAFLGLAENFCQLERPETVRLDQV